MSKRRLPRMHVCLGCTYTYVVQNNSITASDNMNVRNKAEKLIIYYAVHRVPVKFEYGEPADAQQSATIVHHLQSGTILNVRPVDQVLRISEL
jgi:hypothetical protein